MTSSSSPTGQTPYSLLQLLDECALTSMMSLVNAYAPEEWPIERENADQWCDFIAKTSYYMAASMMDARSTFYDALAAVEEQTNDC